MYNIGMIKNGGEGTDGSMSGENITTAIQVPSDVIPVTTLTTEKQFPSLSQLITDPKIQGQVEASYDQTLPYHNLEHMHKVERRVTELSENVLAGVLASDYYEIERQNDLPAGTISDRTIRNLMVLAARFHDAGHHGYRFMQEETMKQATGQMTRKELEEVFQFAVDSLGKAPQHQSNIRDLVEGKEPSSLTDEELRMIIEAIQGIGMYSTEQFSVRLMKGIMHESLREYEVEIVENMILATAFGQNDPALPEWKRRDYSPVTVAEKLLVLADIGSFIDGAETVLMDTIAVREEEVMTSDLEMFADVGEVYRNSLSFLDDIVLGRLEDVEKFLQPGYFESLRGRFEGTRREILVLLEKILIHELSTLPYVESAVSDASNLQLVEKLQDRLDRAKA